MKRHRRFGEIANRLANEREVDYVIRMYLVDNLVEELVRKGEELRHRVLNPNALLDSRKRVEFGHKATGSVLRPWW